MLVDRGYETNDAEDTVQDESSINTELAELSKYVEVITSTIREMESPVNSTSDQLPQATAHLSDLATMTEEGAHKVLTLTEEIEKNRGMLRSGLDQLRGNVGGDQAKDIDALLELVKADEERLLNIHVALSFQDLVAQRVGKLVTILNEVQHKLLKLVVVFGIKQKKDGGAAKDEGRGYEMLRQLESTKTTALEQDLVDDILSEYGFS
ncbi:MAG: protein phosphatase CheZ [Nitrospirales bacterium]